MRLTLFIFSLTLLISSCKLFDGEATVPAYIYIKPVDLQVAADLSQGQASIDTEDVWVFVNGKILGTFAPKSLIPVVNTGNVNISANAGIRLNGLFDSRLINPTLTDFRVNLNLKPEQIDTLTPVVTYLPNTKFSFIEDFDKSGLAFEYNPQFKTNGDTLFKQGGSGSWNEISGLSGKVTLANDSSILEFYSNIFNDFPQYTPAMLELDYKNSVPFYAGIYLTKPNGEVSQIPLFFFNENSQWNRTYLSVTEYMNNVPAGTQLRVFFRFSKLYGSDPNPTIWLDNIKLLYLD